MKKSKQKRYIFVLLILVIGIGYAVITTSLGINADISFKQNSWDVHFEDIRIIDSTLKNGTATIKNDDNTSINFGGNFSKPGEYLKFSVYVVNSGTVVASLDEIKFTGISDEVKDYFNYSATYYDGAEITKGDELTAGGAVKVIISLEYKYNVDDFVSIDNLDVTVSLKYVTSKDAENGIWNYDFVDKDQEFIAPYNGSYKLEVWGAQGGYSDAFEYIGGYGGYSVGFITLSKNDRLYINVGEMGSGCYGKNCIALGGYNGGGNCISYYNNLFSTCGAGGGATHIALVPGLLSSLESFKGTLINNSYYLSEKILIVAGGGAGGAYTNNLNYGVGGHGGGYTGSTGTSDAQDAIGNGIGIGGSQVGGGVLVNWGIQNKYFPHSGTFGQGYGNTDNSIPHFYTSSGGGGGFFGGGGSEANSGGGGSGYIGNASLTNKAMYCYECQEPDEEDENYDNIKTISTTNVSETPISGYAKIGNGYVRIAYLGNS